MAKLDMYFELQGGSPAVVGETLDSVFKIKKAMEIISFNMGGATDPKEWKDDDYSNYKALSEDSGESDEPLELILKRDAFTLNCTIKKYIDKASPALFLNYAAVHSSTAKPFTTGIVSFRKSGGGKLPIVYLTIEMRQVRIVGYSLALGAGKEQLPTETLTLRFGVCKYTYKVQADTGIASRPNIKGFDLDLKTPL